MDSNSPPKNDHPMECSTPINADMLNDQKRRRKSVGNACLRCQAESKKDTLGRQDCVVVWGECNHSFHHCCMSLWIKQNNRCPLCQQEWSIQRMGK
ncbi:RING-box protein 2-like [Anopheles cruzii]|uniref:RING-box protein 2-like n=1 Tax=Anopheles cruzii TaxID=68878 RepID=UPI0022EC32DE|nr:RING-box protein 2-like [Anopheles cruzii]